MVLVGASLRLGHWWALSLLVVILMLSCVRSDEARIDGRFIFSMDEPSLQYMGLLASFGDRLEEEVKVNIMLPPKPESDPFLCEYARGWRGISSMDLNPASTSLPVALLVPVGGPCSTEDKAHVMLAIQTAISAKVTVLLLYETDSTFPNAYKTLNPDSEQASPTMDSIGIVYLPFRDGARLYERLNATVGASGGNKNPHFLQYGSESWMFEHSIGGSWTAIEENDEAGYWDDDQEKNPDSDRSSSDINCYYLLLVLAFVPCYWVGYLYGRNLRFQRNEQGSIIGLGYVSPLAYSSSPRPRSAKVTLTPEQFDRLQRLSYKRNLVQRKDRADGISDEADPESAMSNDVHFDCSIPGTSNGKAQIIADDEQHTIRTAAKRRYTCKWTECSICLEEFQMADTVILLPICEHGYHEDCIRFWLTEKQNLCPLCKTPVLVPENDNSDQVTVLEHSSVDEEATTEAEERSVASTEQQRSDRNEEEFINDAECEENTTSGS